MMTANEIIDRICKQEYLEKTVYENSIDYEIEDRLAFVIFRDGFYELYRYKNNKHTVNDGNVQTGFLTKKQIARVLEGDNINANFLSTINS